MGALHPKGVGQIWGTGQRQAGPGTLGPLYEALAGREVARSAEPVGPVGVGRDEHTRGSLRCLAGALPAADTAACVSVCACACAHMCTQSSQACVCTHVSAHGSWALHVPVRVPVCMTSVLTHLCVPECTQRCRKPRRSQRALCVAPGCACGCGGCGGDRVFPCHPGSQHSGSPRCRPAAIWLSSPAWPFEPAAWAPPPPRHREPDGWRRPLLLPGAGAAPPRQCRPPRVTGQALTLPGDSWLP